MTDLLLDANTAVIACQAGNSMGKLVEEVRGLGGRLWLYAGEFTDICRLLSSKSVSTNNYRQQSLDTALKEFNHFARGCCWLAALSVDVEDIDDPDPMAVALIKAAERISTDTLVVSTEESRIERGFPFVDELSALASISQSEVLFVDLKAQQDRIRPELEAGLHRVLHHGIYINGPEITQLEYRLADYAGTQHCICVSSGTDALLIAMMALGIKPGDEIITTSHTACATIAAIVEVGGIPKFVDIKESDFTIDTSKIPSLINKKTKAIIAVHIYGNPTDMDDLIKISKDCSQAHGATYKNKKVGTFGNISCFSLYPTKNLGAFGDAGIISTNNISTYKKIKLLREYGWKEKNKSIIHGVSNRLDEIQAGILNVKIKLLDRFNKKRKIIAEQYLKEIKSKFLILPKKQKYKKNTYHLFVVRINKNKRKKFINYLKTKNILCGIHYPIPNHQQKPYQKFKKKLPITERVSKEIVSLPIYPLLKPKEIKKIINSVNSFKKI